MTSRSLVNFRRYSLVQFRTAIWAAVCTFDVSPQALEMRMVFTCQANPRFLTDVRDGATIKSHGYQVIGPKTDMPSEITCPDKNFQCLTTGRRAASVNGEAAC